MEQLVTKQIRVYGIVQGVGFRPTVARHARRCGVRGSVCNFGPYVEIFAQGTQAQTARFLRLLEREPPRRAVILKLDVRDAPDAPPFDGFAIAESGKTKGEIFVSPDIAVCDACTAELFDPANRRYLHPFINCTCCGPRLTILDALPYDRERTSMRAFPMCPACAREYHDPATRRYDAQPVCCNDCGPQVYLLGDPARRGAAAITAARQTILDGGIVAVKGIGGFHLCCDATNPAAVERLRRRKRRPMKPFAVMLRDWAAVERECRVQPGQKELLTGHQKPILLLERRGGGRLCAAVAPDNPNVGVMLPYAPVQLLLFRYDDGLTMPDCLVMTSGNVSGAPICRSDADAAAELGGLCDCILSHDREIRIRADDSVADFFRGRPYMIRRSRGYAPLPVMVSGGRGQVLAVGGELKNTFCAAVNDLFYLSPYVGDLADLRTVKALKETIGRFLTLLEAAPAAVACDLHPGYNSVQLAHAMGLPVVEVQHHYAHVLSCMAENDWHGRVLGLSFDGTGLGTDGTIWGGELLLADEDGFERLGSIRPFWQPGGDAAAREGWRVAVSMLRALAPDRAAAQDAARALCLCTDAEARAVLAMTERRVNTVLSTSAGRLFDAVSAILGVRRASTFEGEAATALQFRAEAYRAACPQAAEAERAAALAACAPAAGPDGFLTLPADALVRELLDRRLAGGDAGALAFFFHSRMAAMMTAAAVRARETTGTGTAALSGGVFQNRLLLDLTVRGLEGAGFRVLTHSLVPPNDGGLALGQAVAAMRRIGRGQ